MLPLFFGCAIKKDFGEFMRAEIGLLGGENSQLPHNKKLLGKWCVSRDRFGVAVDTYGIQFEAITNYLTSAYGEPLLYTGGNERHGPIFLYPPTKVGIAIFVSETETGAEVTLSKPP